MQSRFTDVKFVANGAFGDVYVARPVPPGAAASAQTESTIFDYSGISAPADLSPPEESFAPGRGGNYNPEPLNTQTHRYNAFQSHLRCPPAQMAPLLQWPDSQAPLLHEYPGIVALKKIQFQTLHTVTDATEAGIDVSVSEYEFCRLARRCPKFPQLACLPESEANELTALRLLRGQPGVMPLVEYFSQNLELILVMPYCNYNLAHIPLSMPERIARIILRPVFTALAAAHSMGITHCDVKPSNILAQGSPNKRHDVDPLVFLTDWGSALLSPELQSRLRIIRSASVHDELERRRGLLDGDSDGSSCDEAMPLSITFEEDYILMQFADDESQYCQQPRGAAIRRGTRAFLPPEVLLGAPEGQPSGDIWAAGLTIISLLTGTQERGHPWARDSDIAQLSAHVEMLGPLDHAWPKVRTLPDWGKVCFVSSGSPILQSSQTLQRFLPGRSVLLCDMLAKMLRADPSQRLTAAEVLKHPWWKAPQPGKLTDSVYSWLSSTKRRKV